MSDGLSILVACGLWLFIFIGMMGIMYFFYDRKQRNKKFREYEYPSRRKIKNRDRTSETVIASFKDLSIDEDRNQCYKLLITKDMIYLIQYFQTDNSSSSGYPGIGAMVLEFFTKVLFKNQVQSIARGLDRRRLEKSDLIKELLERTNFFYEIKRSHVSFILNDNKLILKHKGVYLYGRKGKGPDDYLNEKIKQHEVEFHFDNEYYNEYDKLVKIYSQDR